MKDQEIVIFLLIFISLASCQTCVSTESVRTAINKMERRTR